MRPFFHRLRRTFVGDKAFYRAVLAIIIPVIIQNGISNFVNLLDNVMVGALGDGEVSGVAIANQLIFVFNLTIFGGLSGPGIFGAQFYGAGNIPGLRNTFRIKLLESFVLLAVACTVFLGFGPQLISIFLQGEGDPDLAAEMLRFGNTYLRVMLIGLPAFALSQSYAGTLREMGETRLPMVASVTAVATNALFNYLLIFDKIGLHALSGVVGAATATVLSRYVELGIIVIYTHARSKRFEFIQGAWRSLKVPVKLLRSVLRMGAPLLMNELLWSVGMSTLSALYSRCGLLVVPAVSINSTISNLFNSVYMSMGTAVSVMVGQALGAGDFEKAKTDVWKLMAFGFAGALAMGGLLVLLAPVIPLAYTEVTPDVRHLATGLLTITACVMPLFSIAHCSYFTLRSGGKTIITFLFDCGFTWVIAVPTALLMVSVLRADILLSYAVVELTNIIKCTLGITFIRKGTWIQNIARAHSHA
ncbi:MAG: MATE family efflux transporter [Clostridia bacterium]|nr:MATE family efflux transporter [Clostridia bacterium]